jgi:hypothetical protein
VHARARRSLARLSITTATPLQTPPPPAPFPALLSDAAPVAASDPANSNPPLSSAIVGANLLNAARIDYRHSSPVRIAPKAGNGRLSRVGILAEPRRQNLARPRGRDVWDVPESPEKRPFQLHETVNREPLRILKKKKLVQQEAQSDSQDHVDSNESQSPISETPMPSSPPRATGQPHKAVDSDVHIEQHLPNGTARCAVTSYRSDKPRGPRYEQCHNGGTHSTDDGPRCTRHVGKTGSVRCEYVMDQDGNIAQCRTAGVNGTTRCGKHAELETRAVFSPKRKPQDGSHGHDRELKSAKSQKHATAGHKTKEHQETQERLSRESGSTYEVQIPVRQGINHKSRKNASITSSPHSDKQDDGVQSDDPMVSASTETIEKTRLKKPSKPSKPAKVSAAPQTSGALVASDSRGDEAQDSQLQDNVGGDDEVVKQAAYIPEALGRVFHFLDLGRRPGRCQTKLCIALKRMCVDTHSLFQKQSLSFKEVAQNIQDIRDMLKEVGAVKPDEDRRAVKMDIYGYVFRSLTKVLKSLYSCLAENCDDIMTSLEAIRIISPLVHDILALKDCIAEWKVSVPQLFNGDRIIKDADSHMIAPLREVEGVFSKRLSILEDKEKNRKRLARFKHELEEEKREVARDEEAAKAKQDRWKHWQALHITRMECEPDPRRRRSLWIVNLEDLEEKDANGVTFERLPVFKNRNTLPLHRPSSSAETKSWSTDQETALMDGLQKYAGRVIYIAHYIQFLTV